MASLDSKLPVAVLVAQQLSPNYESQLVEILDKVSPLLAQPMESGMIVQPGFVYVVPAGTDAIFSSGTIRLTQLGERRRPRPSIDALLETAAKRTAPAP